MRVSRVEGDKDFDSRDRVVKCKDVEVKDWLWACTHRNVVVTAEGAQFGSVFIEALPPITVAKAEIVEPEFPAGSEWKVDVQVNPPDGEVRTREQLLEAVKNASQRASNRNR